MSIDWRMVDVPLGGGLDTKSDAFKVGAPKLTEAKNVVFKETGGYQKRLPFGAMSNKILGGGTLSDIRKIIAFDEELLCFTEDKLYSWAASQSRWVLRDEYLAVAVKESSAVTTTTEQRSADRAEANGVAFYIWTESTTDVYSAAVDVATGAIIHGPAPWADDGADANFVRVVASEDRIFGLFGDSLNGDIFAVVIDPADVSGSLSGTFTVNSLSDATGTFDVAVADGDAFIAWTRTTATAYGMAKVEPDGTVTRNTQPNTADGVIAIAARGLTGSRKLCVMRTNSNIIRGDLFDELTADTADRNLGAIAASDDQLTCAWRDQPETGGEYRCYGFWSSDETETSSDFETVTNFITDADVGGTAANFVKKVGVASHAFSHGGRIYVWLAFAASSSSGGLSNPLGLRAQLQNTYFLYRDDGLLVSKAVGQRAGGFSSINGHLPTVQNTATNVYKWLGVERRVIPIGDPEGLQLQTEYAARSPVDIEFTFDSNDARRTAQLGKTLYISGGQTSQFDGRNIVELGFHIYPWYFDLAETGATSPLIPAGQTHTYKTTWSWENAKGELDRSTVAGSGQHTTTALARRLIDIRPLSVTNKSGSVNGECAVELWRTQNNPIPSSPFYLTTSKDPTVTTGNNRYIVNDGTLAGLAQFSDNFTDEVLGKKQSNPENASVLENLSPPSSNNIFANDERLFLSNSDDVISYSKLRNAGEVASFHDALSVGIPKPGGEVTAVSEFFGSIVAFKESSVYTLPGAGFDNLGGGGNYGPAQVVAADVGAANQESVVVTPKGLIFKGSKGFYIFDRGFVIRYIGEAVERFDGDTILSSIVLADRHEVRFMTDRRCIVYNYVADAWSEWTLSDAVGAVLWDGKYLYATNDSILVEEEAFGDVVVDYQFLIEIAWFKLASLLQGYARCRRAYVLGSKRSEGSMRVEFGRDYEDDYFQAETWLIPDRQPMQLRARLDIQKLQAMRMRISDYDIDKTSLPTGETFTISGIALELGLKRVGFKAGRSQLQ